ncbi:CoA transferase [Amycolatopsis sp. La24]|uniref:CoA transferase n=1 Tax=Amycolatopsis sp. La24 TaxID=3028304 RepID=UPI0023B151F1|nr:CoA transferase [Amycolatopsis sp. La24]
MTHVRKLAEIRLVDAETAGGKGANLGELISAGYPVPDGFVVTRDAYWSALEAAGVRAEIAGLHAKALIAVDDAQELAAACERLRELVRSAGLPPELASEVTGAYRALGDQPLSRSGAPGRAPLVAAGGLFRRSAAQEIALALLAAVCRSTAGAERRGALLDCSVFEAGASAFDPAYGMTGSGTPDILEAYGRPDTASVYPIYRVRDGYVRICVLAKGQWLAMRSWLGDPEPLLGDDLLTNPGRYAKADLIAKTIGEFVAPMASDEVVRECQERRIPAARVLSVGEVLREEHYRVTGVIAEVGQLDGKPVRTAEGMVHVDGRRSVPPDPAPATAQPRSRPVLVPGPAGPYPLSGLTVLDLGVIVAGASAGQLFAQFGARVIRVENKNFPDGMRRSFDWSTPAQARGHRGKESVGLDLRTDEGRRVFHDLARRADLVTSNFKPGTVERLGISYADLAAVNPRLVCVESSAFGTTGPWRTAMGYGALVRAASGLTWLWREGLEDGYFSDGITLYPDHLVGRVCAFAALACLLDARRTGRGAHVTVAQSDVGLVQLDRHLAAESAEPGSVLPPGDLSGRLLPEVVFRAAGEDQWCIVDPRTPEQLAALRQVLGTRPGEEAAAVAAYVRDRDPDAVALEMQAAGVPAARMLRIAELPQDPGRRSRNWYTSTHVAGTDDEVLVERYPVLAPDLAAQPLAPMPMFGAHTRSVLAELGRSPREIEELVAAGIAQEAAGTRR